MNNKDIQFCLNDFRDFFMNTIYTADLLSNKSILKPCYYGNLVRYQNLEISFFEDYVSMEIIYMIKNIDDKLKKLIELYLTNVKLRSYMAFNKNFFIISKISYNELDKLKELILKIYPYLE